MLMKTRLLIGSVLTLAAAACSSDSTGPGPNAEFVGGWSGTTSQGGVLRLFVEETGIVLVAIEFTVDGTVCDDAATAFISQEGSGAGEQPFVINEAREFTVTRNLPARTIEITGLVAAGNATASGSATINSIACNGTLDVTFTLTRATGPDMNLTGQWFGTSSSSVAASAPITFTLTQTGAALTGTYVSDAGGEGNVTGTVHGKFATFTLQQTTLGCTGSFRGHAVLFRDSPEIFQFNYTGSDCLGTHENGSGVADLTP